MVQRASSDAPSVSGGHRESRGIGLGLGYTSFQSAGYNKLFTQVSLSSPDGRPHFRARHRGPRWPRVSSWSGVERNGADLNYNFVLN